MKHILLLVASILVGLTPINAAANKVRTGEESTATQFAGSAILPASLSTVDIDPLVSPDHYQHNYDWTHHKSAVVPASYSTATTLASESAASSGHQLPASLARLYDHEYDDAAFCVFTECFLAPGKGGKYATTPMKGYVGEHYYDNPFWPTKVEYLDDAARQAHKLDVVDGKLYNSAGELFDTAAAKTVFAGGQGKAIYVMDEAGNIFVSNYQAVGKFHHSSLLAGKPVAAAGEISVRNGVIREITRKSGHYRPEQPFLQQFLDELTGRGVDLSDVKIGSGF